MHQCRYLIFNLLRFLTLVLVTKKTEAQNGYSPLLLALYEDFYHIPDDITTSEDQKQTYYTFKKEKAGYFCPIDEEMKNYERLMEDTQYQHCLVERIFKKEEKETCVKEPKPLITDRNVLNGAPRICGPKSSGRLYSFAYEVCVKKSGVRHSIKNIIYPDYNEAFAMVQFIPAYEICYDHSLNQVYYTIHKLRSPKIFNNRSHNFSENEKYSTETYGLENLKNLKKTLDAYKQQSPNPADGEYQLQMLVPTEDFALEYWMKTTFHTINYAPQHKSKVALWNAINSYLLRKLITLDFIFGDMEIRTGTLGQLEDADKNPIYLGNDKQNAVTIPHLWWKMFYCPRGFTAGVVLIMNNIDDIDKICEEQKNACEFKKWKIPFNENILRNLYCCRIVDASTKIAALRDMDNRVLQTNTLGLN